MYATIGNVTREIIKQYVCVNSNTKAISKMYCVVDGITKLVWKKMIGKVKKKNNHNLSLSNKRYDITSISFKNYALFAGGVGEIVENGVKVDVYNSNLTFINAPELNYEKRSIIASTTGDYALLAGGIHHQESSLEISTDEVEVYDSSLSKLNELSLYQKKDSGASTIIGDKTLIMGGERCYVDSGYSKQEFYKTVDVYDDCLTHTTTTDLSCEQANNAAVSLGEYGLVGGGFYISNSTIKYNNVIDAYDSSLTKRVLESLSVSSSSVKSSSTKKYALFVVGGEQVINVYDKALTRFTLTNSSELKKNMASASIKSLALFGGGDNNDIISIYDNSLTQMSETLSSKRSDLSATSINNYVIFAGGKEEVNPSYGSDIIDVFEYY